MNLFDILKEILGSPAGSFGFVFFVLALIAWVIHKVTEFITVWRMKEKELCGLEERTNKQGVKVDILDDKYNRLETKVDNLAKDVMYIKTDISYIKTHLELRDSRLPGNLVQSHSPVSLTDEGKRVAEELGVAAMIEQNWQCIYEYISNNVNSDNAYDIQQFCIETATVLLGKLFTAEDVSKIKTYAYNAGMPLGFYGGMIGVLIRDRYFKQKDINTKAVDDFDPNK